MSTFAGLGSKDSSGGTLSQYYGGNNPDNGTMVAGGMGLRDSASHSPSQYYGTSGSPQQLQPTFNAQAFGGTVGAFTAVPVSSAFNGLTWMRVVYTLVKEYWDSISPYRGQLFPSGNNTKGPGQAFPY